MPSSWLRRPMNFADPWSQLGVLSELGSQLAEAGAAHA